MLRRLVPTLLVLCSSSAFAEVPTVEQYGFKREVIRIDPPANEPAPALVSQTIYLNRCVGGCQIKKGADDDATTTPITSAIPDGDITLSEFVHSETVWNDFVTCMKEIYSPYDVNIVETRPPAGTKYHMAIVAGTSQEANRPGSLGVAIVRGDCAPRDNAVSLSFANSHNPNDPQLAYALCHTVGQESAHAFGLDHSYKWLDGRSTCNDPMTYQFDCGGQRFYRNELATCGEFEVRSCNCGTTQNSHAKILATFGASQKPSLIPPPTAAVTMPAANQALGAVVVADAGSKRGVAKVELVINGFKWAEVKGANFGFNGQPNPSQYTLTVPTNLPNSKVDIVVRAYDDLGAMTESAPIASYKGDPNGCVDASTCLAGQKCEAGKCFWDPPAGEIGDECTYPQFCKSMNCQGEAGSMICTQSCIVGATDACPDGLECIATGQNDGICYFSGDGGGCCSVSTDNGVAPLAVHGGIAMLLLGLMLRRRRAR